MTLDKILDTIKAWYRVDANLREPQTKTELRKALGLSQQEFIPIYKQAIRLVA